MFRICDGGKMRAKIDGIKVTMLRIIAWIIWTSYVNSKDPLKGDDRGRNRTYTGFATLPIKLPCHESTIAILIPCTRTNPFSTIWTLMFFAGFIATLMALSVFCSIRSIQIVTRTEV